MRARQSSQSHHRYLVISVSVLLFAFLLGCGVCGEFGEAFNEGVKEGLEPTKSSAPQNPNKTYDNEAMGFALEYPRTWTVDDVLHKAPPQNQFGLLLTSPEDIKSGLSVNNLLVSIVDETGYGEDVHDHVADSMKAAIADWPDLKVIEQNDVVFDGLPAVRMIFTYSTEDSQSKVRKFHQVLQYWIVKDEFAYSVAYTCSGDWFEQKAPGIEKLIKTFKIIHKPDFGVQG